jgi:hypothetical protein
MRTQYAVVTAKTPEELLASLQEGEIDQYEAIGSPVVFNGELMVLVGRRLVVDEDIQ